MARMTLQSYRDYVREWFDLDETDLTDNIIDQWVKDGFNRIHRLSRRLPYFEDTTSVVYVSGQQTYDISLDTVSVASDGTWGVLEEMEHDAARRHYQVIGGSTTSGRPQVWSQWKGQLELWPMPNISGTLTLDGYRTAADWFDPGSSPDLPSDFDQCILDWVMSRAYKHEDDPEMCQLSAQDFQQSVSLIMQNYMTDTSGAPTIINRRRRPSSPWPTFNGGPF